MIAPLRRAHRGAFLVLGVGLPALYVAALLARPDAPVVEELPRELRGRSAAPLAFVGSPAGGAARARLDPDERRLVVELPDEALADASFYWLADGSAVRPGDAPPAAARLLAGPARPGRFALALPADVAADDEGRLLVVSVAHGRVARVLALTEDVVR